MCIFYISEILHFQIVIFMEIFSEKASIDREIFISIVLYDLLDIYNKNLFTKQKRSVVVKIKTWI
jgi:hypothetical protein